MSSASSVSTAAVARGRLTGPVAERLPEELVQRLSERGGVRIERIVFRGHTSPEGFWYDQAEHEWVALLTGAAQLELASGELIVLSPGDWVELPAHTRHRVAWTAPDEDSVWLAVFMPQAS